MGPDSTEPLFLWQVHHFNDKVTAITESLKVPFLSCTVPVSTFAALTNMHTWRTQGVAKAQKEGLIRHIGLCNVSVMDIVKAREVVEIVTVQNKFSLWDREAERSGVLQVFASTGCNRLLSLLVLGCPLLTSASSLTATLLLPSPNLRSFIIPILQFGSPNPEHLCLPPKPASQYCKDEGIAFIAHGALGGLSARRECPLATSFPSIHLSNLLFPNFSVVSTNGGSNCFRIFLRILLSFVPCLL